MYSHTNGARDSPMRTLPQLPPLHDPRLTRTVFTPAKAGAELSANDNSLLAFRGGKLLDYVVSEAVHRRLRGEGDKLGVPDAELAKLQPLHRIITSPERLVKWTVRYGLDDMIIRERRAQDHESGFDHGVYVTVFKAYVGALLDEGVLELADITEWIEQLAMYSFDTDVRLLDEEILSSLNMEDNSEDAVKFSKNLLYKILNPLRHVIDYRVLDSKLPPQSQLPWFQIGCYIDECQVAIGEGQSKAKAGNNAAYSVLMRTRWKGSEGDAEVESELKELKRKGPSK